MKEIAQINKASSVPLYDQLVDILVGMIKNELKPNDKMLSERVICQTYDVSRTTVRLALSELENMGWIYKRHGKGTFVAALSQGKQNLLDNYSFTDQMREMGRTPQTKVLLFEIVQSNQYVSEEMGIDLGEAIYRLKRLRLADETPMMVEISYIPVELFKNLEEERIATKPLYEIFQDDYNQVVRVADEEFSASLVTDKEAELLDVEKNSACLRLKRTSYNKANKVIEFTLSTARSDQFVYKVRHTK
ncbi:GntR family transcriptional regulator [Carnobacterium gallinarum]|uniref:GntR family transcriptional regulator n=1 Tax=Carnobacterium gallinarum TaxID=2749 RepID=UPI000553471D|nr:GntR family transcriptional regulator [Carnobacterium gallinarum]